jgi:predicted metal-dependent peptidase
MPDEEKFELRRLIYEVGQADMFCGEILAAMTIHETQDDKVCETAMVTLTTSGIHAVFNTKFLAQFSEAEAKGIIEHEVYHVLLGHLSQLERPSNKMRLVQNYAQDAVINDYPKKLPACAVRRKKFGLLALGLEKWSDLVLTKELVDRLTRLRRTNPNLVNLPSYMYALGQSEFPLNKDPRIQKQIGKSWDDLSEKETVTRVYPQPYHAVSVQVEGVKSWIKDVLTPSGFSSEDLYQFFMAISGCMTDEQMLQLALSGGVILLDKDNHKSTESSDTEGGLLGAPLPQDLAEEVLRQKMEELIEKAEKEGALNTKYGYGSGGLLRVLKTRWRANKVNWKQELRRVLQFASQQRNKVSWKKLNRRFGPCAAGVSVQYKLKIAVCVDTSGSVSAELLSEVESELKYLQESGQVQKKFPVIFGDTKVTSEELFSGKFNRPKGGGGTDMNPLIQYVLKKYEPDVVLVCTDGWIPPYDKKIKLSVKRLLWLLVGRCSEFSSNEMPGTVLRVKPSV